MEETGGVPVSAYSAETLMRMGFDLGWAAHGEAERVYWTTEVPTVPGWYWHRPRPGRGIWIKYLRHWLAEDGPLWVEGGTSVEGVMANYPGSEWAGPLALPDAGEPR